MGYATVLVTLGLAGVVLCTPTLYKQRQEGTNNIRADITDSQIIIVPSKELMNIGLTMLGKSNAGRRAMGERLLQKLGFARASLSPYAVDVDRNLARVQPVSPDHNLNSNAIPIEPQKPEIPLDVSTSVKKDLKENADLQTAEAPGASAPQGTDDVQGSAAILVLGPVAATPTGVEIVEEDLQKKVDELKNQEEAKLENLKSDKQETQDEITAEKPVDEKVETDESTEKKELKKEEILKNKDEVKLENLKDSEDLKKDENEEDVKEDEKKENDPEKDEPKEDMKESSTEEGKKRTMKMEEDEILTLIQSGIEECGPDGHRNSLGICVYTPIIA